MQFVRTADLKPGMRLAKPIYNRKGVLLYERDTKLTIQGISSIENFGLIGIFILEPAEPVPPLSKEDLEFEQFQTIFVFKLRENMDRLQSEETPDTLIELAEDIHFHYGTLDHKMNFAQNLRSSADFVYKHAISAATLTAMLSNELNISRKDQINLIVAALLMDFGYLFVPQAVLDKGEGLTTEDKEFIQTCLERGYEALRPQYNDYNLPQEALTLIHLKIFQGNSSLRPKETSNMHRLFLEILRVADQFDRLTAMNIDKEPMSELAAMNYFFAHTRAYNTKVVSALSECIHILPTGACVDLSDGEKALVLSENVDDFSHPMIYKFSDHQVYDLSDVDIAEQLKVVDIMKTMDNRIAIDEETLKQFSADKYILETTERFRRVKERMAASKRSEDTGINLDAFHFED
jgi:HD-GYP domain-containing protein (c-di-GMP phosphodiesterase class II)